MGRPVVLHGREPLIVRERTGIGLGHLKYGFGIDAIRSIAPGYHSGTIMNERVTTDGGHIGVAYSVLADRERRAIVRTLGKSDTSMTVSTLADRIGDPRDERPVRVRLYHQHLPKMGDAGVVEYDREDERVSLTPMGHRVHEVLVRTVELFNGGISPAR